MLAYHNEMSGRFKLTVRNGDGSLKLESGWSDNVITNVGLNRAITANAIWGAGVGSGTAPELPTDTALGALIGKSDEAGPGDSRSTAVVGSAVSPYYSKIIAVNRFPQGRATGNISEVGMYSRDDEILWSRTLVKDTEGAPVTITVLADEILDVTYECRVYPQETPIIGTVTLGGVSHTYKLVAQNLDSPTHAEPLIYGFRSTSIPGVAYAYTGGISAPPANEPSGTAAVSAQVVLAAYITGTYTQSGTFSFNPGVGTMSIKSFSARLMARFAYSAIELTPAYVKAAAIKLDLTLIYKWGRRIL